MWLIAGSMRSCVADSWIHVYGCVLCAVYGWPWLCAVLCAVYGWPWLCAVCAMQAESVNRLMRELQQQQQQQQPALGEEQWATLGKRLTRLERLIEGVPHVCVWGGGGRGYTGGGAPLRHGCMEVHLRLRLCMCACVFSCLSVSLHAHTCV